MNGSVQYQTQSLVLLVTRLFRDFIRYAKNRGLQAVNASAVAIISFLILTPTTLTVVRKLLVQLKLFILDLMEFFWGSLLP